MRIVMRPQDAGRINPALDRQCKFAVSGNQGLAGTAIISFNLPGSQTFKARGRASRAGAGNKDHPALVAFSLSPADTLKRYPSLPYGFKHRGIFLYRDELIHGKEKYTCRVSHTLPQYEGDREILSVSRAW
jgi:hypothetical protein